MPHLIKNEAYKTVRPSKKSKLNVDTVSDDEKEIEKQSKWIESDEAIKVKVQKDVSEPTQAEIEEHNVAHVPFRSWCPHCVKGKANGAQHRKTRQC